MPTKEELWEVFQRESAAISEARIEYDTLKRDLLSGKREPGFKWWEMFSPSRWTRWSRVTALLLDANDLRYEKEKAALARYRDAWEAYVASTPMDDWVDPPNLIDERRTEL